MNWTVIPQETKKGPVLVKQIKFAPQEDGYGNIKFIRLKPNIQQVLAGRGNVVLKIKRIISNSGVKYVVQHPDKVDFPNIKVGMGKKARIIPDVLSEKVLHRGRKDSYDTSDELLGELNRFMGTDTSSVVVDLLKAA